MINHQLNEAKVAEMSKEDLRSFIKDILSDELGKDKNKISTKEDVRSIVRDMLKKHYRNLWTNAPFYIDKL